jgi:predicted RNA-binding Zn-ribbon protein involved in translation (DUF1610 family)
MEADSNRAIAKLDGNAIAGMLLEVFGIEMTDAKCMCANCDAQFHVAETEVYLHAPGTVVRCHRCRATVMVFVTVRDVICVDLRGLAALERAAERP